MCQSELFYVRLDITVCFYVVGYKHINRMKGNCDEVQTGYIMS